MFTAFIFSSPPEGWGNQRKLTSTVAFWQNNILPCSGKNAPVSMYMNIL